MVYIVYISPKILPWADNHQLYIKLLWIFFPLSPFPRRNRGESPTLGATLSTNFVREDSGRKIKFRKQKVLLGA